MRLASFWDRLSRQQSGMASPQIRGGTYGHWRYAAPSAAQLPVAAHGQTVPPTPPDPACRRQATTPGGQHASQAGSGDARFPAAPFQLPAPKLDFRCEGLLSTAIEPGPCQRCVRVA